jgi:hypothetical protein
MNKKRLTLEAVNEYKWVSFHSSTTCGIVFFLFIHNLWYWSLFIHPQPLVWVYYKRLWMNKKRPIPEVVDEQKETYTRGCE